MSSAVNAIGGEVEVERIFAKEVSAALVVDWNGMFV